MFINNTVCGIVSVNVTSQYSQISDAIVKISKCNFLHNNVTLTELNNLTPSNVTFLILSTVVTQNRGISAWKTSKSYKFSLIVIKDCLFSLNTQFSFYFINI